MKKQQYRISDPFEKVQLLENREISPGVHLISYPRIHRFHAGQVVKICLSPGSPFRIYSICSGPDDPAISILFNIKEQGWLTPRLATAQSGDVIYVSEPYGSFTLTGEKSWWIATGTGIAPFYSMLRTGKYHAGKLLHGVRQTNQFYFDNEFLQSLGSRYIRCCSGEASTGIFTGRVTDYLKQETVIPPDIKYYLCGKALMVVETRDILIERGVPFSNILSEIYF